MDSFKKAEEAQVEIENVLEVGAVQHVDIHEFDEQQGHIVDIKGLGGTDLKLADDGHIILVPQPSADPQDPLN